MDPSLWGGCVWNSVHIIALGYPKEPTDLDRQMYTSYYAELWKVLPCYKCSVNYKRHLEELPIENYLDSNDRLFEWTVKLHNIVNKELGKKEITVAEAFKIHTGRMTCARDKSSFKELLLITGILGLLLVIAFLLIRRQKISR